MRYDYSGLSPRNMPDKALRRKLDYCANLMRFHSEPPNVPAYGIFADCYDEMTKRGILIANDEYKRFRVMAELEKR